MVYTIVCFRKSDKSCEELVNAQLQATGHITHHLEPLCFIESQWMKLDYLDLIVCIDKIGSLSINSANDNAT